jgi:glycerol kinase
MLESYVLALDQGTTSSRAIVWDRLGRIVSQASIPLASLYPRPGWVEQDAEALWAGQLHAAREAVAAADLGRGRIGAIGITNQRETVVVWDARTGEPLAPAISWRCRRTAAMCEELAATGWAEGVRERTGLVLDPYFSATKIKWLLDHVPGLSARAHDGHVRLGTVDTWLLYRLSGGRVHATDPSNASRTMLFNIHDLAWDPALLALFDVQPSLLPAVRPTSAVVGIAAEELFGEPIPIAAMAGDQQAALFGQACFAPGDVKATYGTGAFILMNTGPRVVRSGSGLVATVAWGLGDRVDYALEGSVFTAGDVVRWLRALGVIADEDDSARLAASVESTGGVYLVPAFGGLGSPHWDARARGTIVGLTAGSDRRHLVRAALEGIAYQVRDVLEAMERDAQIRPGSVRVDGKASGNDFLMRFQADLSGIPVLRSEAVEATAFGAACLAGLAVGVWRGLDDIAALARPAERLEPTLDPSEARKLVAGWQRAVERAKGWAE